MRSNAYALNNFNDFDSLEVNTVQAASTCPTGYISYVIRRGETLWGIAQRYNTTVAAILAANPGLDANLYYEGDTICVPSATAPGTPSCPNGTLHTIVSGDTLFALANRYGTTVAAIQAANPGLNPNSLRVGQIICIPTGGTPSPSCPNGTLHTIVRGDTLFALANRYGTTVAAIQAANPGLNPNALQVGQVICIPTGGGGTPSCPNGTLHTIVRGDTLFALANRYGTTVAAIQAANPGLNPNALQVGQVICIPTGGGGGNPSCPNGTLYTIARGDTFFAIANRYGVTVAALQAANPGVDPTRLQIGQVICVPTGGGPSPTCPNGTPYTVQRGDSFYLIARRYGVSLADLLAANPGVNPEQLQIGQVICIPTQTTTCPTGYTSHNVTQGQAVADILVLYNVSYSALSAANPNVNLSNLTVGQTLCVPPSGSRGVCSVSGIAPYVMQRGDTLSSIATAYNTSVSALLMANPNLTPTDFVTGRIICLPQGAATT